MTVSGCPAGAGAAVDWVLGTLAGWEGGRFGRHLETCATCAADVARLQRIADALAESPRPAHPPTAIRARLVALAEEEAALSRALDHVDAPPVPPDA
jgi:anti-sigma factor RsiW